MEKDLEKENAWDIEHFEKIVKIFSSDFESDETKKITEKIDDIETYLIEYDFKKLSFMELKHYYDILKDLKLFKSNKNMGKEFTELLEKHKKDFIEK